MEIICAPFVRGCVDGWRKSLPHTIGQKFRLRLKPLTLAKRSISSVNRRATAIFFL